MGAIDLFQQRLGRRPYCGDNLATDGLYRLPLASAMTHRLIQPNTAKRVAALCFDIDRNGAALDWYDRHAPAPNLSVMNPANGHAHLIYLLSAPVAVSDAARIKPVQYLAAIQEGLRSTLEADRGYSGLVVKNPANDYWITREWNADPYGLDELADCVVLPSPAELRRRASESDYAGLGRNCTLFEMVRKRAYSLVRDYWRPGGAIPFASAVVEVAEAENTQFSTPLSASECRAIARSVSRWVWQRFNPAEFRAIQAARGSKKGARTKAQLLPSVIEMASQGVPQRVIADTLGISQKTVSNWIKSIRE
ncbi:hypothetical protein FWJ25_17810 [Marinobacter salinexigens]|uniref:Primase C-terminal 1 domain-containing protein n=1 Tax=Marinobacter salinexigens TaxID=2919747 RepID=A0A5B0V8Z0_9GAMM|nr:replication initiation protein [Marinobacter salinexigens]KAA1171037.1 hypothetical protein FWJ25_17810 [Marinobacter salinexigens]